MPEKKREKAGGYHGVQNMKLAPKTGDTYAAELLPMLYAKNLSLTVVLEAVEQHADNVLTFRVPKDDGYEGEVGSTAPDPEIEKAAGYAIEGDGYLVRTNMTYYPRGALYYEFLETDAFGRDSVVKVWLYNVELGKGSESYASDSKSIEFGEYKYPIRVFGEKLMNGDGTGEYLDERGLGRRAAMCIARPGDSKYTDFGKTVPMPKLAAENPPPPLGG